MIKYVTHSRVDITVDCESTRYKIPFVVIKDELPEDHFEISKAIVSWWDWDRETILNFIANYITPIIDQMQSYILY